jgi:hypothetical protein
MKPTPTEPRPKGLGGILAGFDTRIHSAAGAETSRSDEEKVRDLLEGIREQVGNMSKTIDKTLSGADVLQDTDNRMILG